MNCPQCGGGAMQGGDGKWYCMQGCGWQGAVVPPPALPVVAGSAALPGVASLHE